MADIRTLKLNLLADTANFKKGLRGANKASETFAGKVGLSINKANIAFAALSGSIYGLVRASNDFIKVAAEDEKSQRQLRKQLQNTLKATDLQIASVERYIEVTQNQFGIQDDKLRPSFARLVRSTKDAAEAQKFLNLAIEISAATQKPLESVTNALGKAIDGNTTSLGRLGLGIDSSILKSKDLDLIYNTLAGTFKGFAENEATTFEGKLARISVQFDTIKEKIGGVLIDKLSAALPYVQQFAEALASGGNKKSLAGALSATAREASGPTGAQSLAQSLIDLTTALGNIFDALFNPKSKTANDRLQAFADALSAVASAINAVAGAYRKLKDFGGKALGLIQIQPGEYSLPGVSRSNVGGTVGGGGRGGSAIGGTTIVMNGIVDGESARRSIERLIQQSARRSGTVNWSPVLT